MQGIEGNPSGWLLSCCERQTQKYTHHTTPPHRTSTVAERSAVLCRAHPSQGVNFVHLSTDCPQKLRVLSYAQPSFLLSQSLSTTPSFLPPSASVMSSSDNLYLLSLYFLSASPLCLSLPLCLSQAFYVCSISVTHKTHINTQYTHLHT